MFLVFELFFHPAFHPAPRPGHAAVPQRERGFGHRVTRDPSAFANAARNAVRMTLAGAVFSSLFGCTRADGTADIPDATATTGGLCIGNGCPADPGWGPVDCTQEQGIDKLEIESFDDFGTSAGTLAAQDLYTYYDGTSPGLFFEPAPDSGAGVDGGGFEPAVTPVALCAHPALAPNQVFHIFGGPFLSWGGGFGIPMAKLNGRDPNGGDRDQSPFADPNAPKNICCPIPGNPGGHCPTNVELPPECPPSGTEFAVSIGALDVSQYEGVSFWARRGPGGQAGLRVNVGDKFTDDDLNYLAQRQQAATGQPEPLYCTRSRECDCLNHHACQLLAALPESVNAPEGTSGSFCLAPGQAIAPQFEGQNLNSVCNTGTLACPGGVGSLPAAGGAGITTCCGLTVCDQPYAAYPCDPLPEAGAFANAGGALGDPQFFGRPCTPYVFANGFAASYCFDPATDEPPPPSTETCGDFWMTTVTLGTEWTFYKVPFNALRQQGFGKRADILDLHSVSVVRFTFDVGWVDYWIDSVSFYRFADD
ncbi:MAG: hypothetical protein ABSC94_03755 [Polyangiaceae bacterium]|jgi:hypothetical protein